MTQLQTCANCGHEVCDDITFGHKVGTGRSLFIKKFEGECGVKGCGCTNPTPRTPNKTLMEILKRGKSKEDRDIETIEALRS